MMALTGLFNSKHAELKIVAATVLVLIALPVMAVVVVASSGVAAVSAAIAVFNPQTNDVTLYDANGVIRSVLHLNTIWPTVGYVSSEFGTTEALRSELGLGPHTGIDIANAYGIPVYAFADGTILRTDTIGLGTCGKYVQVTHVEGVSSLYCHLESVTVRSGDSLKIGQQIGEMGSTGASSGPHLHFQITVNNLPINPRTFVSGEPERGTSHEPGLPIPSL